MKVLFRQFLFLIALAVAMGPAMAKDESGSTTSKLKKGLFSKKSSSKSSSPSSSEGKSQYKKIVVNVNKASASALSAYLVGIGPTKAQAIVDYRRKNGKFTSAKDLMKVDGIGEATFDGLKKNISTSRGEISPPKGYKMGEVSKKSGSSKKSSSSKKRSTTSSTSSKSRTSRSADSDDSSSSKKMSSKSKSSKTKAKKTRAEKMKDKMDKKTSSSKSKLKKLKDSAKKKTKSTKSSKKADKKKKSKKKKEK